jgi:3',5'-cyclic AMP phosphodiesterase CpdA
MRLIVTADLHYDHANSREPADAIIAQINQTGCDILLFLGDAAVSAGETLERCLSAFTHAGPKLFLPGNHELWTSNGDSYELYKTALPARVRSQGWQWLDTDPFASDSLAIVGTIGWYDYSFAQAELGIPRRFYEQKISPGAASLSAEHAPLFAQTDDISPAAMQLGARWNDGRFVHLQRSDDEFLSETVETFAAQLRAASQIADRPIVAATHHLPFRELLPPSHNAQWNFSKAYLGSGRLGNLLLSFPAVKWAFCGHSHFPARAQVGHIQAINIGSGYRDKRFEVLEV